MFRNLCHCQDFLDSHIQLHDSLMVHDLQFKKLCPQEIRSAQVWPFFLLNCVLTTFLSSGGEVAVGREDLPEEVQFFSIYWISVNWSPPNLNYLCKTSSWPCSASTCLGTSCSLVILALFRAVQPSGNITLCENLRSTQFLPRKIITFYIEIGIWGLGSGRGKK